jgi:hypothetical protein
MHDTGNEASASTGMVYMSRDPYQLLLLLEVIVSISELSVKLYSFISLLLLRIVKNILNH